MSITLTLIWTPGFIVDSHSGALIEFAPGIGCISKIVRSLCGAVSFCVAEGYVCGDRCVTLLCDLFGGHNTTAIGRFC